MITLPKSPIVRTEKQYCHDEIHHLAGITYLVVAQVLHRQTDRLYYNHSAD